MKAKRLLLISLCALLTLPACSKQEPNVRGTIISAETSTGSEETSAEQVTVSTSESDPSETESTSPESSSSLVESTDESGEEADDSDVSLGHSTNNLYVNEFIGIGCKLSNEWQFLSDDEIREVNNISIEKVGNEYKEALTQLDTINDMLATDATGDSISITLEKLGYSYYTITAEQYIEVGKESVVYALKKMGLENIETISTTITFLGEESPCVIVNAIYNGNEVHEIIIPYECPGYMAVLAVSTFNKNLEASLGLIDYFYKLD